MRWRPPSHCLADCLAGLSACKVTFKAWRWCTECSCGSQAGAGGAGAPPEAGSVGEALAVTPRRLPAGLPLAMALALTDAPSEAGGPALAGGGPTEGARRLLLLAPGPDLLVLDVSDDAARPTPASARLRCKA